MASRNDFVILNKKCEKYFDYFSADVDVLSDADSISDVEKRRLGFYFFVLENITHEKDPVEISNFIIDTQFNYHLDGTKNDDGGIDAVHIDDDLRIVRFFNFKFREKFKPDSKQHLNDPFVSGKFLNVIKSENVKGLKGKPKKMAEEVIDRLNSNDEWELILYQVSNDSVETEALDEHIKNLMSCYDLRVECIGLPSIAEFMSIRPKPINASLVLESDAIMSFEPDNLASSKSYIARISGSEIVRITCDSEEQRNNYNIENIECLTSVDVDYDLLFDNVRGLVLNSKFNPNIKKTLKENPKKFFMYNNGVTIVAKDIDGKKINGDKRVKLDIRDFQVLNGGQTVRTIHKFNGENSENISKYLSQSEVLVRIFKADSENDEINRIAEYTNSQNSIRPSDLKSLSSEQIEIERYLDEYGILYSRKTGDTGEIDKDYKHKITMEKFGQLLTAIKGNPERSTNSIQNIFDKYYDEVFLHGFEISNAPEIIETYFSVVELYKKTDYKKVNIKYFYVAYLVFCNYDYSLTELVDCLEECLGSYTTPEPISDVRKMGQAKFREYLENKLNKDYNKLN